MPDLTSADFRQFFSQLHGTETHPKWPFPWQETLADQVCTEGWPSVIDLPTASGKTACIDIALFALAVLGEEAPRRIFFIVDRRVVVNEAHLRMKRICESLKNAESGIVRTVADRLRALAGGQHEDPLRVYELRGAAYRDETWVRNPLQPAVVATTVDQVGSRLLFRGYGVSPHSWPLHAALIGNDALLILDEAHCSRAFAQTLSRIEKYRSEEWSQSPLRTPFRFVEMTATPTTETSDRYSISERDRADPTLHRRLYARKPTRLSEPVKGKKDDFGKIADELINQANLLAQEVQAKRVAIFVNRVRTAKIIKERLPESELLIGRMRPIDRDAASDRLANLKSGCERKYDDVLQYVVSTQCLEVGADLDFDIVVSECASIDALLQRLGRLDRLGDFGRARAAIVIGSWQIEPKQPDPVYGESLSNTWKWLKSVAGESSLLNMGIESEEGEPETVAELLKSSDGQDLRRVGKNAPVLLPAHVDAFAQTSPVPDPDPLVELFLHGPDDGVPDIQVVWRADLNQANEAVWGDVVALCPPSSAEAMPVQINTFKKWLTHQKSPDAMESDLEIGTPEDDPEGDLRTPALVWRGENEHELLGPKRPIKVGRIRPGDTIVLPASAEGWNELGHKPVSAAPDVGDEAAFKVRKSVSLRVHPELVKNWPETPAKKQLEDAAKKEDNQDEITNLLKSYRLELAEPGTEKWPRPFLDKWELEQPSAYSAGPGYVLEIIKDKEHHQPARQVLLETHTIDIQHAVGPFAAGFSEDLKSALQTAAMFHDYGKADVRYQAWLRAGDRMAAQYAPKPIAKSGVYRLGLQTAVGLPEGFRHELLSLLFAQKSMEAEDASRDLILHLIASHHGHCRPFAPVILDGASEYVSYAGISICKREREEKAPHRLESGVAGRFWKLTRQYGWWGLAYLEALLRLSDWKASEAKNVEVSE